MKFSSWFNTHQAPENLSLRYPGYLLVNRGSAFPS